MDNSNLNNENMENIKNLINNGNLSEAMSHISPEMIQNFTQMMNNNQNNNQTSNSNNNQNTNSNANQATNNQNFDFSNVDMATVMKITSAFNNMNNNKNDPKANLLNSLKPYLRDEKKGKLDNYMNLLNMGKIAEVLKDVNFNKENNNNGNV